MSKDTKVVRVEEDVFTAPKIIGALRESHNKQRLLLAQSRRMVRALIESNSQVKDLKSAAKGDRVRIKKLQKDLDVARVQVEQYKEQRETALGLFEKLKTQVNELKISFAQNTSEKLQLQRKLKHAEERAEKAEAAAARFSPSNTRRLSSAVENRHADRPEVHSPGGRVRRGGG